MASGLLTVDDLLETPLFQGLRPTMYNQKAYALWLLTDGDARPPWRQLWPIPPWQRLRQALFVIFPFPSYIGRPTWKLFEEGVVWDIPELGRLLVTHDDIEWAPTGTRDLTNVSGNDTVYSIRSDTFEYRESYSIFYRRYPDFSDVEASVIALRQFGGDDLISQSNRVVAHRDLAQHVAFSDDTVIVPSQRPLHREVIEALNAIDSYPILDESVHSELEQEAESTGWIDYGRREFVRELMPFFEEYLDEFINHTTETPPNTPLITEAALEDAVETNADVIWSNLQQHASENLWDEQNGFYFREAKWVLDRRLKENEIVIAPVLTRLGLLVELGDTQVHCSFCGVPLQQSFDYTAWVDSAGNPNCMSGEYVGQRHAAYADSMGLQPEPWRP
jgi:hypothetical protein